MDESKDLLKQIKAQVEALKKKREETAAVMKGYQTQKIALDEVLSTGQKSLQELKQAHLLSSEALKMEIAQIQRDKSSQKRKLRQGGA